MQTRMIHLGALHFTRVCARGWPHSPVSGYWRNAPRAICSQMLSSAAVVPGRSMFRRSSSCRHCRTQGWIGRQLDHPPAQSALRCILDWPSKNFHCSSGCGAAANTNERVYLAIICPYLQPKDRVAYHNAIGLAKSMLHRPHLGIIPRRRMVSRCGLDTR